MIMLLVFNRKEVVTMQTKQKRKHTKEKNTNTIHKILHNILKTLKSFYAIVSVLKAILKLFS